MSKNRAGTLRDDRSKIIAQRVSGTINLVGIILKVQKSKHPNDDLDPHCCQGITVTFIMPSGPPIVKNPSKNLLLPPRTLPFPQGLAVTGDNAVPGPISSRGYSNSDGNMQPRSPRSHTPQAKEKTPVPDARRQTESGSQVNTEQTIEPDTADKSQGIQIDRLGLSALTERFPNLQYGTAPISGKRKVWYIYENTGDQVGPTETIHYDPAGSGFQPVTTALPTTKSSIEASQTVAIYDNTQRSTLKVGVNLITPTLQHDEGTHRAPPSPDPIDNAEGPVRQQDQSVNDDHVGNATAARDKCVDGEDFSGVHDFVLEQLKEFGTDQAMIRKT